MRLKRLWIGEFKNLKDFTIEFDDSPYTVLVGQNGSGKSNLFEALARIFAALEAWQSTDFAYGLSYISRGSFVEVRCDPTKTRLRTVTRVSMVGEPELKKRISMSVLTGTQAEPTTRLLPELVFGYYSGTCGRFEATFHKYQRAYTRMLGRPDIDIEHGHPRRLFAGALPHTDLLLLALHAHGLATDRPSPILGALSIRGARDVEVRLRRPPSFNPSQDDPRRWGVKGPVGDIIYQIRQPQNTEPYHLVRNEASDEVWRLSDTGLQTLAAMSVARGTNLFSLLLEARTHNLLTGASFAIELTSGPKIRFDELSEGEKQLLLVMGMLRFAEHKEALFLLDEPDTHLNPQWSLQYLELVEEEVGHQPEGHIIMATHDPLTFAGLKQNQVQILSRDTATGKVTLERPDRDPKGMGVPAILMSDLFGLRSVLDLETQGLLDDKRTLAVKDERTDAETKELKRLNGILEDVDVSLLVADPLYPLFVKWVVRQKGYDRLSEVFLDPELRELQDKIAERAGAKLMEEAADDEVH